MSTQLSSLSPLSGSPPGLQSGYAIGVHVIQSFVLTGHASQDANFPHALLKHYFTSTTESSTMVLPLCLLVWFQSLTAIEKSGAMLVLQEL